MQTIELTDKEAQDFLMFREHQDLFTVLLDNGIHKMNNGNMVISFKPNGDLRQVKIEQVVHNT